MKEARSSTELLHASDEAIDDAVAHGDPLTLRGLIHQLTGDQDLLDIEVGRMVIGGQRDVYYVQDPDSLARIRTAAAAFLRTHRDSGGGGVPIGPAERLHRSLSLAAGTEVDPAELEQWLEELGLDPWARGISWAGGAAPADASAFSVVIIGAGMGGLNAAIHLKRAGIPFTVLEKNPGVGGTWFENRYPGARVDSPSRTYSHIYGVDFVYRHPYSPQAENEEYFNWIADTFGVRGDIELGTEVGSVIWDEAAQLWEITADQSGEPRVWRANAVISAVGFLSRPSIPTLPGIEDFRGTWFHTSRWPEGTDLTGQRVAVIGTGSTGYQTIPEIARHTEHLYIFQRTPNWLFDAPGYLSPFPEQVTWLDRNLPYYSHFARFQLAFGHRPQNSLSALQVDPDFHDEHAVSRANRILRDERLSFLASKLGGRPDLLEKMTPAAPPMSARPVLVDRAYSVLDVLLRDDVTLVSDGVGRVTEAGIELSDGTRHDVDLIVLATGFRANDFLWPMQVQGRDGLRAEDLWAKDGARAYLGSMLPGFPNFFMVYGPNTNQLAGLQIAAMEEVITRFALESITALIEQRRRTVEVTADGYWRYNAVLDEAERLMTYVDPRAHNYYQNVFGRSSANFPLDTRLLWHWTRDPGRRHAGEGGIADDLLPQYHQIDPHFGADLVVE